MSLKPIMLDGHVRLVIDGSFTLAQAAYYKKQLLQALAYPAPLLAIDLSALEEIDTAGLQLLLLLQRETAAHGKCLVCDGMSPVLADLLDMLQLRDSFPMSTVGLQRQT